MKKVAPKLTMISSKIKRLIEILEAENYRLFNPLTINYALKPKNVFYEDIQKTFNNQLEGKGDPFPQPITFPIVHDTFVLLLDEELSFHRYRAKTFKSALYEKLSGLNVNQYRRYCRIYEKNCLKVGLREGIWSNSKAEKHFGVPSEPGDFFANGSPGWKLLALQEFLRDAYAIEKQWNLYHISIYDNLLIEGKLQPLGKLLETGSERYQKAIFNYLKLKMGL